MHLNLTNSRRTDEDTFTRVDVEPVEVLFDTFDVHIPRKAIEAKKKKKKTKRKIRYTEGIDFNRKEKDIDSLRSKSKNGSVIFPTGEQ